MYLGKVLKNKYLSIKKVALQWPIDLALVQKLYYPTMKLKIVVNCIYFEYAFCAKFSSVMISRSKIAFHSLRFLGMP